MNIFISSYQPPQAQSLHGRALPRLLQPRPSMGRPAPKEYAQKHWSGVHAQSCTEADLQCPNRAEKIVFAVH